MPEFKEKPKMGQPKSKRSAMLDPRHRAVLLKEKYRQQMEQRQDEYRKKRVFCGKNIPGKRHGG